MVLLKGLGERMAEDERRRVLVEGNRSNTSHQMNEMKNSNGSGYAEVNGTSNPPASAITAAPSSGGYLWFGLMGFIQNDIFCYAFREC